MEINSENMEYNPTEDNLKEDILIAGKQKNPKFGIKLPISTQPEHATKVEPEL